MVLSERDYYRSQFEKLQGDFCTASPVAPEKSLFSELEATQAEAELEETKRQEKARVLSTLAAQKELLEYELAHLRFEHSSRVSSLETQVAALKRAVALADNRIQRLLIDRKFYHDERNMYRSQVQNFIKKKSWLKRIFKL